MKKTVILGGGAAGLCAAITAARAGASVTICEKDDRVGKKILRTGNGRCNLSNTHVSPSAYNHPDFVTPVLKEWECNTLRTFFKTLGLYTYEDDAGRIYPVTDAAASVLDVLRLECAHRNVNIITGFEVASVTKGLTVTSHDGRVLHADAVIAATGGGTKPLEKAGLENLRFSPVLCPLKTDLDNIKGLSGIRIDCRAELLRDGESIVTEEGELLFRDYGISGIMVFDLSRFTQKGDIISLDLMPSMSKESLTAELRRREKLFAWREGSDYLAGMFHSRVAQTLLRRAGSRDAVKLAEVIKNFRLTVLGCGDVKQAQVTRGGLDTTQFDPATLMCRTIPNLYACGEALDIDGRCGGYNLHWAFASGITAGKLLGGGK